jgi:hypothetical protein
MITCYHVVVYVSHCRKCHASEEDEGDMSPTAENFSESAEERGDMSPTAENFSESAEDRGYNVPNCGISRINAASYPPPNTSSKYSFSRRPGGTLTI